MARRTTRLLYPFLPTLVLAMVFALAPIVSQLLMVGDVSLAAATDIATHTVPCPVHGHAMPQSADPPDSGPVSRQPKLNCYCGLICHAALALPSMAVPPAPQGRAPGAAMIVFAAHTFEPSPMPRPPNG